ncbi:MAG: YIP1 family protein [Chloroflexota bacterium]
MSSEAVTLPPSIGFGSKLISIFIRPRTVFNQIANHKSNVWIIVGLLGLILITLPIIVSGPLTRALLIAEFEENSIDIEFPEDQPDPTQFIANPITTTVIPAVGVVFTVLFGWLLWGGALHLISSLTGGRNTFLQMLRLVIWSWMPYGLRAIIQTIYIAATNTLIENPGLSGLIDDGVSPDNPFAVPEPSTVAFQTFLGDIDIFLFWRLTLLILGIGMIAQLPRRKAMIAALLVWAVFALIRIGAAVGASGLARGFAG